MPVAIFSITSQWHDPEILIFSYKTNEPCDHGKIGHILKPLVPKFHPDLSARLKDIAEKKKQVPAKLKPMVGTTFRDFNFFSGTDIKEGKAVPYLQQYMT